MESVYVIYQTVYLFESIYACISAFIKWKVVTLDGFPAYKQKARKAYCLLTKG